jgi:F-type H+-transporting ATPase subunit epsilon
MAAPAAGTGAGAMRVSVLSPEQTVYEGDATSVVAPAWNGQLGHPARATPR